MLNTYLENKMLTILFENILNLFDVVSRNNYLKTFYIKIHTYIFFIKI